MYRGNGKKGLVSKRSAVPWNAHVGRLGWMGRQGDHPNPNTIGVFIPSRVRISRALPLTHAPASRSTPPTTRLGGFARRRAVLTPAPALGHQSAWLWVGAMPRLRACALRCPSLVGVGGARSDGRPFVSERASAPTDSLRGLGAEQCPHHRQPSRVRTAPEPRAVGFAPQTASHAGLLTDPNCYKP